VSGEPGIGKTRLMEELAADAVAFGVQACWSMCWEGESTPPFWPWVQLVRQAGRTTSPADLSAELDALGIRYLLPELQNKPADALARAQPPDQDRFWLFDAITRFFVGAAVARPLLLILEDVHWSDAASMLLLRFLARQLRDSAILIVGTYRDTEVVGEHPVGQLAAELTSENQRCHVAGLSQSEVGELLEQVLGRLLDQATVADVHRRTGGNPLFARELARSSAGREDRELRLPDRDGQPAGDEVQGLIQRRLSRLSTQCRDVLAAASVIGPVFTATHLAQPLGLSHGEVLGLVEEARTTRLLQQAPDVPGGYQFSHALVRDVLYRELGAGGRASLHSRVAHDLQRRSGQLQEAPVEELAYHFGRAAFEARICVDEALSYAERAGERAFAGLAYEASAEQFARAVDLLALTEQPDNRLRCRLLLALGRAQMAANDVANALATYERAAALARLNADAELLAHAALGMGMEFTIGAVNDVEVSLLDESLRVLDPADSSLRARVLARLGAALLFSPSADRRAGLSRDAMAMARRLNDPATLARVLYDSHVAALGAANPEERLGIAREVVQLAERCGDQVLALQGRALRLGDLLDVGELSTFRLEAEFYDRQTRRLRQTRLLWHVPLIQATLAALEGRFEEAERLVGSALRLGQVAQQMGVMPAVQVVFCMIRIAQGRASELEEDVRRSVQRDPALVAWRSCLAYVLCEAGRAEEARLEFEGLAVDDFARLPRDFTWATNLAILALACAWLGDRRRAELLYGLMLPYGPYVVRLTRFGAACMGSMSHYLGLLAGTLSRWDDAIAHFEDAIQMNARLGAPPFVANSRHQLARALRARGYSDDEGRAVDELAHVRATLDLLSINLQLRTLR
jgi:tetratricopeptide (TPR) repeat protein